MPPKLPRVQKHSTFFITINTNVPDYHDESGEVKQRFATLIDFIFQPSVIRRMLRVAVDDHPEGLETIESIDGEYVLDIGPEMRCIHAHARVNVTHRSVLQYDIETLRTVVNTVMGRKTHIHVKSRRNHEKSLENYIKKPCEREEKE